MEDNLALREWMKRDDKQYLESGCVLNNGCRVSFKINTKKTKGIYDELSGDFNGLVMNLEYGKNGGLYSVFNFEMDIDVNKIKFAVEAAVKEAKDSKYPIFKLWETINKVNDNYMAERPPLEELPQNKDWYETEKGRVSERRYDLGGRLIGFDVERDKEGTYSIYAWEVDKNSETLKTSSIYGRRGLQDKDIIFFLVDKVAGEMKDKGIKEGKEITSSEFVNKLNEVLDAEEERRNIPLRELFSFDYLVLEKKRMGKIYEGASIIQNFSDEIRAVTRNNVNEVGIDKCNYILVRDRGDVVDVWYFKEPFNKKSALEYIRQWDGEKERIDKKNERKEGETYIPFVEMPCFANFVLDKRRINKIYENAGMVENFSDGVKMVVRNNINEVESGGCNYILTRDRKDMVDVWYFKERLSEKAALEFIRQWDYSKNRVIKIEGEKKSRGR